MVKLNTEIHQRKQKLLGGPVDKNLKVYWKFLRRKSEKKKGNNKEMNKKWRGAETNSRKANYYRWY